MCVYRNIVYIEIYRVYFVLNFNHKKWTKLHFWGTFTFEDYFRKLFLWHVAFWSNVDISTLSAIFIYLYIHRNIYIIENIFFYKRVSRRICFLLLIINMGKMARKVSKFSCAESVEFLLRLQQERRKCLLLTLQQDKTLAASPAPSVFSKKPPALRHLVRFI